MRLLVGTRGGLRTDDGTLLGLGGRPTRGLAGRPDNAWVVVDGREVWRLDEGRLVFVAAAAAGDPALTCTVPTPARIVLDFGGAHPEHEGAGRGGYIPANILP